MDIKDFIFELLRNGATITGASNAALKSFSATFPESRKTFLVVSNIGRTVGWKIGPIRLGSYEILWEEIPVEISKFIMP